MGDDDELGLVRHLAHIAGEAHHVGVVQGGLDLVHDAERGRPHLQNGEVKGDGHEGLLAAGEEGEHLEGLAGGLHPDFNATVEDVLRLLELQGGLAAAEQLGKGLLERLVDDGKLPGEDGFHLLGDVGDDALQLLLGLEHVVPLVGQVGVPLVDPLELLNGIQVDIAQTGDRLFQLAHPALGLGDALQLHPLGAGGLMGQLIGLPQLVQQGFLLQGGGGLPLF